MPLTLEQQLANGLDRTNPKWFIEFANEQELRNYVYTTRELDVDRFRRASEILRSSVIRRLWDVASVALNTKWSR